MYNNSNYKLSNIYEIFIIKVMKSINTNRFEKETLGVRLIISTSTTATPSSKYNIKVHVNI